MDSAWVGVVGVAVGGLVGSAGTVLATRSNERIATITRRSEETLALGRLSYERAREWRTLGADAYLAALRGARWLHEGTAKADADGSGSTSERDEILESMEWAEAELNRLSSLSDDGPVADTAEDVAGLLRAQRYAWLELSRDYREEPSDDATITRLRLSMARETLLGETDYDDRIDRETFLNDGALGRLRRAVQLSGKPENLVPSDQPKPRRRWLRRSADSA
jgi:hypothetical protein